MADWLENIAEKISSIGSNWASYSIMGSFALYVLGYLALRFHLTALGVGADLMVLDERYLFTGAKFLIWLAWTIPSAILLGVLLFLPIYGVYRLTNQLSQGRATQWVAKIASPHFLLGFGILLSLATIQFLMKDCSLFKNLLLGKDLPKSFLTNWLVDDKKSAFIDLFFVGLTGAALISVALVLAIRISEESPRLKMMRQLLISLVAIQWLLIPVNYGYLLLDMEMPRVKSLDGVSQVQEGTDHWLVWEGKEGKTFLLRTPDKSRSLLTLPNDQVKTIEITGYDPIISTLHHP